MARRQWLEGSSHKLYAVTHKKCLVTQWQSPAYDKQCRRFDSFQVYQNRCVYYRYFIAKTDGSGFDSRSKQMEPGSACDRFYLDFLMPT